MGLQISGKNIDVGEATRGHIEDRIGEATGKYFDGGFTGHVTMEREGSGYHTEVVLHLDTGVVLQAQGRAQDARQSFDVAAERIDTRLRRYKRRLKDHHNKHEIPAEVATSYVIAAPDEQAEVEPDYNPVIIAEEATNLQTMTVAGAVVALDMSDRPLVVFKNAAHGAINVVYRRSDGNIGWVDPALSASNGN